MKKKTLFLLGALSAAALTMAGCDFLNPDSSESNSSSEAPQTVVNIVDSAVNMDHFDTYDLDLELKNTEGVVWSSSDPSVVTVDENGRITSKYKSGTSVITATSGGVSDTCEVSVLVKSNLPILQCETSLYISEGGNYTATVNAYYKDINISEYLTFSLNEAEDATDAVSATLDGNAITFTGNTVGSASYTVSTTIFGALYAETIHVDVRNTDIVYVVNGAVDNRLQVKKDTETYTSDIEIYDKNVLVADDTLQWNVADDSIVTIGENGRLVMGNEGITTISTTYRGRDISVEVSVVKEHRYVTVAAETPAEINLNVNIEVDTSAQTRKYTTNTQQVCTLTLTDDTEAGRVVGATIDGKTLNVEDFSYANGVASIAVKTFDTDVYGAKTLLIRVESQYVVNEYTVNTFIVTKSITNVTDFKSALSVQWRGDRILGYFALANDIDCNWYELSTYATDWNWENGFRGTLDGRGYSVQNFRSVMYGITAQIGEGAVFKNLKFPNVRYDGGETTIFGRGAAGATFENIEITLTSDSTCSFSSKENSCGVLVSHDMRRCTYKDITLHAEGKALQRVFGGTGQERGTCVYENVKVYAVSVEYFEHDSSKRPSGVTLISD